MWTVAVCYTKRPKYIKNAPDVCLLLLAQLIYMYIYMYSTDQRQGIMRLRLKRGTTEVVANRYRVSASLEPRSRHFTTAVAPRVNRVYDTFRVYTSECLPHVHVRTCVCVCSLQP